MATTFIEITNQDGSTTEYAIIDQGNGEYTSMTKATYLASLETPTV
jgi:hypothetical protein